MVMQTGYTTNPTPVTTTTGLTNSYFNNLQLPATGTPIAPTGTGTVLQPTAGQPGYTLPSTSSGSLFPSAPTSSGFLSNVDLSGIIGGLGQTAAAAAPYLLSQSEIDRLAQLGATSQQQAQQIAQTAAQASQFQPFSIKTSTGAGTTFETAQTPYGQVPQLTYTLSPEEQAIQQGLLGGVQGMVDQAPVTAESLYGQIRGLQTPEEERQRIELENRLAAQGRLGVQTAAYGGSPEQLALAQAQEEARNRAALQALEAAPRLQQQGIQNITGMLGAAYLPQEQAMAGLMPGIDISRIAQAAQQGQAEALYRGGIAGLEAQAAAGTAAANVEAARTQALANALSGMFARPVSNTGIQGTSSFQSFIDALGI